MICPNNYPEFGTEWGWDGETVMKATGFVHQIESSSFLISFKILLECPTHLRGLTIKLQKQAIDVLYVHRQVSDVLCYLKDMREKA